MKKPAPVAIALMVLILFNGCTTGPTGPAAPGQTVEVPGSKVPVHTKADLEAFLNREPTSVMAYAGPFYFGSFDGFDAASQKYSGQRREKTEEILAVVDGGIDTLGRLDKKLREEKDVFQWYVLEIQKIDKSTVKYTDGLLHATNLGLLSSALSDLMRLRKNGDAMPMGADWGYVQFQKYASLVELTNLYGAETASLTARMSALYFLLDSDSNPAYQELNKQFVAKIDPVSEQADEILNEANYAVALAGYGEKLLFTADYYFTRDTLKLLDTQIADAKKSFAEYAGTNQHVSDGMLALLKKKLATMEAYRNGISKYLDSIPAEELIAKEQLAMAETPSYTLIPLAYAQMDIPGWFQQKVSDTVKFVKSAKNLTIAAVRVTGQEIKKAYVKSGAHEVVKDGAQIINSGLEVVNSSVKVAMQSAVNIYYGDMSWDTFKKQVAAEKQAIHDRFVAGTLGKETYDQMIKGIDDFQEKTGKFVKTMGELSGDLSGIVTGQPKIGKFVKDVTIAVGNEAKGVLDGATDFTKNLAIVMHPETSKDDTLKAMYNIYTALKGIKDDEGKLVEVELPDLEGLTKDKAIEQLTKDISKVAGLDKEEEEEFLDQLKSTFKEQILGKDKEEGEDGDEEDTTGTQEPGTTQSGTQEPGATQDSGTQSGDTPTSPDAPTTPDTPTSPDAPTSPEASTDPLDQIFTNPNLTDKEIQDIIIGEITKGLPPLPPKPETDDTKDKSATDTDNDGLMDDSDNCESVANSDQDDTDNDGLGNACDPDCSGDSDSDSACDEVDNCPKDVNADQKDTDSDGKGDICDFDAPLLKDIAGNWPGSVTINDVVISDEFRAQAQKEGCDLTEVESSKGQTKPMGMNIVATGENSGYILLSGEDTTDKQIPFTYTDGVLKANMSEEGAAIDFNMTFTEKTATGNMDINYANGGLKISGGMNLKK
jgi:hypothetical protein